MLPKISDVVKEGLSSELSVDIFMASGDLLVAQKDQFLQKYPRKTRYTCNPPWLADYVIYTLGGKVYKGAAPITVIEK